MLVLSRRAHETLVVNNRITIHVLQVKEGEVTIFMETCQGTKEGGHQMSRRGDESFELPGNITVRVIKVEGGKVRLGIEAPRQTPIHRHEAWRGARGAPKTRLVPLKVAIKDGRGFLSAGQYLHVADIVRRLADWNNPEEIKDLRIEPIQGLWELKEKGGILGRINVRVVFAYLKDRDEIVVLGAFKKENEGQTPKHIIIRMHNRLRVYLEEVGR
jgi:carbon storage regulator CsrA